MNNDRPPIEEIDDSCLPTVDPVRLLRRLLSFEAQVLKGEYPKPLEAQQLQRDLQIAVLLGQHTPEHIEVAVRISARLLAATSTIE